MTYVTETAYLPLSVPRRAGNFHSTTRVEGAEGLGRQVNFFFDVYGWICANPIHRPIVLTRLDRHSTRVGSVGGVRSVLHTKLGINFLFLVVFSITAAVAAMVTEVEQGNRAVCR
ncbi:unnamed protein product [Ectocarpus sp. 13 AM-2016]